MEAIAKIIPSQIAYISIPADSLRGFFDSTFASFAKCGTADFLRGFGHRYRGGHDLLLDVFSTFRNKGAREAFHQVGHIVLTDFPTKAGIPIPAFSQSGLGKLLEGWGISSGWLQINICDASVGIIAVAESHPELCNAINGLIEMNGFTFFDTFVEGSVELVLAYWSQNPILLFTGIENILSGCFAIYHMFSIYVEPIDLFGASIFSAIIGFFLTKFIGHPGNNREYLNALRAGAIGACFTINPAFGFGAIIALLSIKLGTFLYDYKNPKHFVKLNYTLTELFLDCLINPNSKLDTSFIDTVFYYDNIDFFAAQNNTEDTIFHYDNVDFFVAQNNTEDTIL